MYGLLLSSATHYQSLLLPTTIYTTPTTIYPTYLLPSTILRYAYYHIPVNYQQHHLSATNLSMIHSRAGQTCMKTILHQAIFYRYSTDVATVQARNLARHLLCDYEEASSHKKTQVI